MNKVNCKSIKFIVFLLIIILLFPQYIKAEEKVYDLVIKGGTIFNPSTDHELSGYNLGIKGKRL